MPGPIRLRGLRSKKFSQNNEERNYYVGMESTGLDTVLSTIMENQYSPLELQTALGNIEGYKMTDSFTQNITVDLLQEPDVPQYYAAVFELDGEQSAENCEIALVIPEFELIRQTSKYKGKNRSTLLSDKDTFLEKVEPEFIKKVIKNLEDYSFAFTIEDIDYKDANRMEEFENNELYFTFSREGTEEKLKFRISVYGVSGEYSGHIAIGKSFLDGYHEHMFPDILFERFKDQRKKPNEIWDELRNPNMIGTPLTDFVEKYLSPVVNGSFQLDKEGRNIEILYKSNAN